MPYDDDRRIGHFSQGLLVASLVTALAMFAVGLAVPALVMLSELFG
jgi:hypothetical protein